MTNFTHKARKRFGQNFLIDQHYIDSILQAIQPKPTDCLIEIGPGKGAITKRLIAQVEHLEVVELDRDLIPLLEQLSTAKHKLTIHQADALRFDFESLYRDKPLRLVGNLPYNISTPLLFRLLEQTTHIQDMHFLLQKEVVDRIAAAPGSGTYGRLSVMMQYFCKPQPLFEIPPGAFQPVPKVDSTFLRLIPHGTPPFAVLDWICFSQLVLQAFSQRRKRLANAAKGMVTDEQLEKLGLSRNVRAEELSLEQFVTLANSIASAKS